MKGRLGKIMIISTIALASCVSFVSASDTAAAPDPTAAKTPTTAPAQTPAKIDLATQLEKGQIDLINGFFDSQKYVELGEKFKKESTEADFDKLIALLALKDVSEKAWNKVIKTPEKTPTAIEIDGELTYKAGAKKPIVVFLNKEEGTWKISGINTQVTVDDLKAAMPSGDALTQLTADNMKMLVAGIKSAKKSLKPFHKSFSKIAQKNIKFGKLSQVVRKFNKQKRDVTLPEDMKITLTEGYPKLQNGQMAIEGSYTNNKFKVTFGFLFDYEWKWRLNSFTLKADPI